MPYGLVSGRGADVDSRTEHNYTPLYYAKSAEMVRLLVKEGGAKVNVLNKYIFSPLSVSTFQKVEITEALLDEGALVKFGRMSPLVHAIASGRMDALKVLLARRGFVRVIQWKDKAFDETAREMAVRTGRHEMVGLLDDALVLAKVCVCVSQCCSLFYGCVIGGYVLCVFYRLS